jgi:O-antigen ligase
VGATIATAVVLFARAQPETAIMLLGGTGIYGAPAHSVVERASALEDTWTVFTQHPFIGRSLGGVSFGIGELYGVKIRSFQDSKPYEGMATFAEVLAASGVFGVIPFVVFLIVIIKKPLEAARRSSPEYTILLRALTRSLIFELAILQFNQNILRPYLWVHLAILATVYAAARPRPELLD